MSFWELFMALASAASIVSLAIAVSSIFNGRATRRVVRETSMNTQSLLSQLHADTQALIQEMQRETRQLLERMDQRADERHRDTIEAIRTLRA